MVPARLSDISENDPRKKHYLSAGTINKLNAVHDSFLHFLTPPIFCIHSLMQRFVTNANKLPFGNLLLQEKLKTAVEPEGKTGATKPNIEILLHVALNRYRVHVSMG